MTSIKYEKAIVIWEDINSCIVPETLSPESVNAALPSAENFISLSGAVSDNADAIDLQETAIDSLETNVTQTNIVPPVSSLEGDEICNAAEYIADKLIELAKDTWEQSGELTIAEFLEALLNLGVGYVGPFLTDLYDAAVPADTATPTKLDDDRDLLVRALYCNELDKSAAKSEITASDMAASSKALLNAAIDAVSEAKWSLWAFVGKETVTGDCNCDTITMKVFDFTLGSALGWTANNIGGGARASFDGSGWDAVNMGSYYGLAIEKYFTWPDDFVITATRVWINDTHAAIPYQYIVGMPYANGTWGLSGPTDGIINSDEDISKGVGSSIKSGIGIEFSKTADTGQRITRIEFEYTGTPPSW